MNPARHPELDSGSPKRNCTVVILNLIQDPPRETVIAKNLKIIKTNFYQPSEAW